MSQFSGYLEDKNARNAEKLGVRLMVMKNKQRLLENGLDSFMILCQ